MKKLALAAALIAGTTSTAAFAGNMTEPEMATPPQVIVEETQGGSSTAGVVIPLILVALIAAAMSED